MDANNLARHVGVEVDLIMRIRDKKRTELAHLLGISPQTVVRRLNGEFSFDLIELQKVAEWLDVPVQRLTDPQQSLAAQVGQS